MDDGFAIVGHSQISDLDFCDWMAEKKGIEKGEILRGKEIRNASFGSSPSNVVQSTIDAHEAVKVPLL